MTKVILEHCIDNPIGPTNLPHDDEIIQADSHWIQLQYTNMFFQQNEKVDTTKTYCDDCRKWIFKSTTISNILKHASIHSEYWKTKYVERKSSSINSSITVRQNQSAADALTRFWLLTGLPFHLIEDEELADVSQFIPNRKVIKKTLLEMAEKTQEAIKKELNLSSAISMAFDEWEDSKARRYLGVTCRALIALEFRSYVLALHPLYDQHLSGQVLHNIIKEILDNYEITTKVTGCVSDNESLMMLTAKQLNIFRCPCIAHFFNTLFKAFFMPIESQIHDLLTLAASLNRSTVYTAYCQQKNIRKVPTYIDIRWTSACTTLLTLLDTKEQIIEFIRQEQNREIRFVENKQWEIVEQIAPFLKEYQTIILFYEKDSFGATGFFQRDLLLIKAEIEKLNSEEWAKKSIQAFNTKLDFLSKKHSDLFNHIAPISAMLNPCIQFTKLYPKAIKDTILQEIVRRVKYYTPKPKKQELIPIEKKNERDLFKKEPKNKPSIASFLEEAFVESEDDLFPFWKQQLESPTFKYLAMVAIDFLGILCTSCSTERSFSKARSFLTFNRMQMSQSTANAQAIVAGNRKISKMIKL